MKHPVSRDGLARIVTGLLTQELRKLRQSNATNAANVSAQAGRWDDELSIQDDGQHSLGCDSLDLLKLGAAVNQMFHLHEVGLENELLRKPVFGAWLELIECAWSRGVAAITVSTSGSTGAPRTIQHRVAALRNEAEYLATHFSSRRRIVSFVPAHHIYGFLLIGLLPDVLGAKVAVPGDTQGMDTKPTFRSGDLVVTYPERWAFLAAGRSHFPDDVEGVTSTAPCPADVIGTLRANGLSRMTELYGSSETAGIGIRQDPADDFTLMPHWSFGFSSEADTTLFHQDGSEHVFPDHAERTGTRTFRLGGRRDGAIQVGGINVWPDRIARQLEGHPSVFAAAVRKMRSEEGDRLKAFVVPHDSTDPASLEADLEMLCKDTLTTPERPKSWTFGAKLPTNAMGKPTDW